MYCRYNGQTCKRTLVRGHWFNLITANLKASLGRVTIFFAFFKSMVILCVIVFNIMYSMNWKGIFGMRKLKQRWVEAHFGWRRQRSSWGHLFFSRGRRHPEDASGHPYKNTNAKPHYVLGNHWSLGAFLLDKRE